MLDFETSTEQTPDINDVVQQLGKGLGKMIARLHNANIIHGDLTTMNIMIRNLSMEQKEALAQIESSVTFSYQPLSQRLSSSNPHSENSQLTQEQLSTAPEPSQIFENRFASLCVVDLGLSFTSAMIEDKAVDIYVLERSINTCHPHFKIIVKLFLKAYFEEVNGSSSIQQRLETVRLRGRKRLMIG